MNDMTIAHMTGILTSAIQAADRLELDALKSPALADMGLDRIRDIKRDCSTCINLLDQLGRERRMSDRQFQESKRIALQRQGWHCMRCGTNIHDPSLWPGRSGHHRQLRRRADPAVRDLPCNIVELCGSGTTGCHGWAHAHPAEAERFGYIIPSWRDPLSVPIRDWNGDWRWLLPDGTAQRLTQIEIIEWQSDWKEQS